MKSPIPAKTMLHRQPAVESQSNENAIRIPDRYEKPFFESEDFSPSYESEDYTNTLKEQFNAFLEVVREQFATTSGQINHFENRREENHMR